MNHISKSPSKIQPKKKTVGFENTPMPVFPLTDDEIAQVIAYIKTLKN